MIIVGLTGSIGMGKTTTAKMMAQLGAAIFDADEAVHELYAKGGKAVPIIRAGIPQAIIDGAVSRPILSQKLRQDPLLFEVLESFIHPLISQMRQTAQQEARAAGVKVFVNDIPLLFETGMEAGLDKVIVVTARYDVQRERVLARPNMSAEKFEQILSRQMSDKEKCARADYIVRTDQGLDFARKQVQKIMADLA